MEQDKQELEVERSNITEKWKTVSLEKEKVLEFKIKLLFIMNIPLTCNLKITSDCLIIYTVLFC